MLTTVAKRIAQSGRFLAQLGVVAIGVACLLSLDFSFRAIYLAIGVVFMLHVALAGESQRNVGRVLRASTVLLALAPGIAQAATTGTGFLQQLADMIDKSVILWAPVLLGLSAAIVGTHIASGSHQSGEKVKGFILGAIFLVLAAGGSAALLQAMQTLIGKQ